CKTYRAETHVTRRTSESGVAAKTHPSGNNGRGRARWFGNCFSSQREEAMTMKLSRLVPVLVLGALAFAAADISVDYDHHADFSQFHRYSWIGVRAGDT